MEGLLSLLLFAGAFYFSMRFGCGARVMPGHHGSQDHQIANWNVYRVVLSYDKSDTAFF